jgi:hypothetical protein
MIHFGRPISSHWLNEKRREKQIITKATKALIEPFNRAMIAQAPVDMALFNNALMLAAKRGDPTEHSGWRKGESG